MYNIPETTQTVSDFDLYHFLVPPAADFAANLAMHYGWEEHDAEIHEEQMLRLAAYAFRYFGGTEDGLPIGGLWTPEQIADFVEAKREDFLLFTDSFNEQIKWLVERYLSGQGDDQLTFAQID